MVRHILVSESRTVLRTMLAGALADNVPAAGASRGGSMTRLLLVAVVVVLAAGVVSGAGAEWHVYPGAGTPIQTAIGGARVGDTIYVHAGTYDENTDVDKRVTLIGDGAGTAATNVYMDIDKY